MTSSLLNAMKSVKMSGSSVPVETKLLQLRLEEIEASKRLRWIMVAANASGMSVSLDHQ